MKDAVCLSFYLNFLIVIKLKLLRHHITIVYIKDVKLNINWLTKLNIFIYKKRLFTSSPWIVVLRNIFNLLTSFSFF